MMWPHDTHLLPALPAEVEQGLAQEEVVSTRGRMLLRHGLPEVQDYLGSHPRGVDASGS